MRSLISLKVFASLPHHSDELYFSLGESLAHFQQVTTPAPPFWPHSLSFIKALADLPREGTDRGETHHWDMRNALGMRKYLPDIEDASRRGKRLCFFTLSSPKLVVAIAENCLKEFETLVIPEYHKLRLGIIHVTTVLWVRLYLF